MSTGSLPLFLATSPSTIFVFALYPTWEHVHRLFVKCVTVASACHRFWRKKLVPLDTVASEPCQGWRGTQSNQSLIALKRMAWQEHRLRLDMPSTSSANPQIDRIRHVRNGGEQRLLGKFLVDGYDTTTRTVS